MAQDLYSNKIQFFRFIRSGDPIDNLFSLVKEIQYWSENRPEDAIQYDLANPVMTQTSRELRITYYRRPPSEQLEADRKRILEHKQAAATRHLIDAMKNNGFTVIEIENAVSTIGKILNQDVLRDLITKAKGNTEAENRVGKVLVHLLNNKGVLTPDAEIVTMRGTDGLEWAVRVAPEKF